MDLTVIGTGHVGLVTGLCFAEIGHYVTCVDNDADKIGKLRRGQLPFFEPHLAELLERNAAEGRLQFESDLNSGSCRPEGIAGRGSWLMRTNGNSLRRSRRYGVTVNPPGKTKLLPFGRVTRTLNVLSRGGPPDFVVTRVLMEVPFTPVTVAVGDGPGPFSNVTWAPVTKPVPVTVTGALLVPRGRLFGLKLLIERPT